jgi:hypothetical protein
MLEHKMKRFFKTAIVFFIIISTPFLFPGTFPKNSKPFFLSEFNVSLSQKWKHTSHEKIYGKHTSTYNRIILKAIDKIQGRALNGGGYYTNLKDQSKESPIGYPLKIFSHPLINPPRTTSYCTGVTFAAFIEALNLIYPNGSTRLTLDRYEALRMQEVNGTRRKDFVKVWGNWNTQWGAQYVMIKYLQMGKIVIQKQARPGDFINILFKGGGGHSAIFLGWYKNENGETQLLYWSSQPETNGISDHSVPFSRISRLAIVRLTDPGNVFRFDVSKKIFFKAGEFDRPMAWEND